MPELAQALGELPLHAAFRGVMVPAPDLGEGDLHPDVGLDELSDLLEAVAVAASRVLDARRDVPRCRSSAQRKNRYRRFR